MRSLKLLLPGLVLAATATGAAGQRARQQPADEERPGTTAVEGEPGVVHPEVGDVVFSDGLVHADLTGGSDQELAGLAGAPQGFAAVWYDRRDGSPGLYAALLDAAGGRVGRDQVVHPPETGRQLDPAIAVGPALSGAVAWFHSGPTTQQVRVRFFDGPRGFVSAAFPLGTPSGGAPDDGGPNRVNRSPEVTVSSDGSGAVGWIEGGRVELLTFTPARVPAPQPLVVNEGRGRALGDLRLVGGAGKVRFVGWSTPAGVEAIVFGASDTPEVRQSGPGRLRSVAPAADGGWWCVVQLAQGFALRHLDPTGLPDREDLLPDAAAPGPIVACDVATWLGGLAVVVERPRESERALELFLYDAAGAPLDPAAEPIALPGEEGRGATGPRIASNGGPEGTQLLVAWTDSRAGNSDVYYRRLSPGQPTGGDQLWNDDGPSADQLAAAVGSNGSTGVLVWQDERHGGARVFARAFDAAGAPLGGEIPVGVTDGRAGPGTAHQALSEGRQPSVAVAANKSFLTTWKQRAGQSWVLLGQVFGPGGRAVGEAFEIDPRESVPRGWAAALVAIPGNQGYLVAWVREGTGVVARHVALDGELVGEPYRLSAESDVQNPDLTLLSIGAVVVWDVKTGPRQSYLAGRIIAQTGRPTRQGELRFSSAPGPGGDLDPAVAPAPNGGFLMSWTGNDGPERNVFARLFDGRGTAAGPLLHVTTRLGEQGLSDLIRLNDRTWVVAWEDDISGHDHVYVRRVPVAADELGEPFTLNQRITRFAEERTVPSLAPLGEGFVAAWTDRRRSRGLDQYFKIVGRRFDRPARLLVAAEAAEQSVQDRAPTAGGPVRTGGGGPAVRKPVVPGPAVPGARGARGAQGAQGTPGVPGAGAQAALVDRSGVANEAAPAGAREAWEQANTAAPAPGTPHGPPESAAMKRAKFVESATAAQPEELPGPLQGPPRSGGPHGSGERRDADAGAEPTEAPAPDRPEDAVEADQPDDAAEPAPAEEPPAMDSSNAAATEPDRTERAAPLEDEGAGAEEPVQAVVPAFGEPQGPPLSAELRRARFLEAAAAAKELEQLGPLQGPPRAGGPRDPRGRDASNEDSGPAGEAQGAETSGEDPGPENGSLPGDAARESGND